MICKFGSDGGRMILLFGISMILLEDYTCNHTGNILTFMRLVGRFIILLPSEYYSVLFYNYNANEDSDYGGKRQGNRVVSLGEIPYFDPLSKSRREALAEGV